MFPVQHKMVQCHYQQLTCWHTLSLPRNNVKDIKSHFKLHQYLEVFEDTGKLLLGASGPWSH